MAAPPDPRKVIASVQQQLGTAFLPAVKQTNEAAANLQRSFTSLQNALEVYARSIRSLAESGRGCQPPGRIHAEKLHVFSGKLKEVTKYGEFAHKTNTYSVEERDKIKELSAGFQKREKAILKAKKQGSRSDADVSNFYQTEMKTLVGQQEMRYRFFVDKQREWADAYVELYKHFDELYAGETRPAVAPVPETRAAEETKPESPASRSPATSEAHDIEHTVEINGHGDEGSTPSEASSATGLPSRTHTNASGEDFSGGFQDMNPNVMLISRTERNQSVLRPTQLKQEDQRSLVEARQILNQRSVTPQPPPVFIRHSLEHEQDAADNVDSHYNPPPTHYTPPPQRPPAEDRGYESQRQMPFIVPVPATRQNASIVVTPPAFPASDYGKTLVITHDFDSTSPEQLTINKGDEVVLIKSGNRGWIFIQEANSLRTGWIPALYATYAYRR